MFCSLAHVLVKTKARPSMVSKFLVFFSFWQMIFRFPILQVMHFGFHEDGTHCPETVAVYEYNILCETYSHSISDTLWSEDDSFHIWERWKINIVLRRKIDYICEVNQGWYSQSVDDSNFSFLDNLRHFHVANKFFIFFKRFLKFRM